MGKAYGILGWIALFSFTEKKESIFNYLPWFFIKEQKIEKILLKKWKKHKNHFIINIKNIDSRSMAIKLTNINILINTYQLPILKKNEHYWEDIIFYKVLNTKNIYLGNVIKIVRTIHNDILVIRNQLALFNNQDILIPVIYEKIIKKIDTVQKIIHVQWD